jgi:light-regulated signal transduction histidine kinase (bacteriophytochrome)
MVPLRARDRVIGTLGLTRDRGGRPYSHDDQMFLQDVADRAALAIANARAFSQLQEAQALLARQKDELERSNADLEQFAYVASHDLQEPLQMVSSFVQLLARRYHGKLDSTADEYINYAVSGAARMRALINDLLNYSRVGTRGAKFEAIDCEKVLAVALTNLSVAIEQANATVTHDPLPTVTADSAQLTQVFQNLIGNGIKFSAGKPPCVHISAAANNGNWQFAFQDQGEGIEPQYFDRIFIIFQRLHKRNEYEGTGIGLAICKKIVERHGGRIWVESKPGQGSTFFFTIPREIASKP